MITPSATLLALFTVLISQVYAEPAIGPLSPTIPSQSRHFIGCTPDQKAKINKAAIVADELIAIANINLKNLDPTNTKSGIRYRTWFGSYDFLRFRIIADRFQRMKDLATSLTYDCGACPAAGLLLKHEVHAYAYPQKDNGKFASTVNLCSGFWKSKLTGSGAGVTQAGIIIWKLSEIDSAGLVKDTDSAENSAKDYADTNPEMAYRRGPNYMYFAENTQLV